MDRKIVVFSEEMDHGAIRRDVIPLMSGRFLKYIPLVKCAVVLHDPLTLKNLAKVRGVADVIDDVRVYAISYFDNFFDFEKRSQVIPWGVDRIEADKAWAVSTGTYIKTAVIDTGIDLRHPDLRVYGGVNTISSWRSYNDDNGHGTHVAGTIAALKNNLGVIGVAYTAALFAVKVLDSRGGGYLSDVIEGLEWCIKNKMQVINMSLGAGQDVALFHEAVKKAFDVGIFIASAAGNNGPGADTVLYPARYPEVAAVAAVDRNDKTASFSSRGPEVDLTAPGVDIYSTYLRRSYKLMSGTSMATPHVAGAAALVLAGKGQMRPGELMEHLKSTSQDLGLPPEEQGAGLVNAYGAVL
ncbi:MAG: S8 family peptidase [Bacillota bacterium]